MPRDTKWKLAVIAGFSECLIYAEAKFCAFEIHGEPSYYMCPRTEYCCNFGCCVSPGFQIYHLWYYWLLVIIMFLVCSGGGWWYRYWLQGRYRAATSAIPNRNPGSRVQNRLRGSRFQAEQARISYNTERRSVLLHRTWKGPQRSSPSPARNGAAASSTHYQNANVLLNDANCPYYQRYGPPPSYETVIAQTRGKPQCFAHPTRPSSRMELIHYPNSGVNSTNSRVKRFGTEEYARLMGSYGTNDNISQDLCLPVDVCRCAVGGPTAFNADKSDSSDAETVQQQHHTERCPLMISMYRIDFPGAHDVNADKRYITKVHELTNENSSHSSSQPEMATSLMRLPVGPEHPSNIDGGPLRMTRNIADAYHHVYNVSRNGRELLQAQNEQPNSSGSIGIHHEDGSSMIGPATSAEASSSAAGMSQLNPSNNVILAPRSFNGANDAPASDAVQPERQCPPPPPPPPPFAERSSTNSNLESKCELNRSKSLD